MSRELIGFAIGASAAGAITDSYTAAIECKGQTSLDALSKSFPSGCRVFRVELEVTAIAGGIITDDVFSVKLAWTSTANVRNLTNIATANFQKSASTTGSCVVTLSGEPIQFPDDGTIGSLFAFVKHNRVGGTCTCVLRITHVQEIGI